MKLHCIALKVELLSTFFPDDPDFSDRNPCGDLIEINREAERSLSVTLDGCGLSLIANI